MDKINRLIIIGNGFDLAHGIKTSFKDFIEDYFSNCLNEFYEKDFYTDILLELNFSQDYSYFSNRREKITPASAVREMHNILNNDRLKLDFKSSLLSNVFDRINTVNWVDIEVEFFNILKSLHRAKDGRKKENISILNEQLDFLRDKLSIYLKIQQDSFVNNYNTDQLVSKFCEPIEPWELVTTSITESLIPETLYFLNFNYTRTIRPYVTICHDKIHTEYNYIHGDLEQIEGKPIFGFGDELDKHYLKFEDEANNDLFKHIKSFAYLQTQSFYRLTRFIEANKFQVHIYGHSCGVSDRTMLSQIFENKNCLSVKIFYHQIDENKNDYTDKTYEISRHFRDKTMLRKKLIPFEISSPMPQPIQNSN